MSWKASLLITAVVITHKRAKTDDFGGFEACLGPELDGKGDGLHGVGMPPDEEAPKQDPGQPIPLGIQVSQVANVVGHHPAQLQS